MSCARRKKAAFSTHPAAYFSASRFCSQRNTRIGRGGYMIARLAAKLNAARTRQNRCERPSVDTVVKRRHATIALALIGKPKIVCF